MTDLMPLAPLPENADADSLAFLLAPSNSPQIVDNADPHPVTIVVHPRQIVDGREWEAEYEMFVDHPSTCSACVEECPVADLADIESDDFFAEGFPQPDDLSDDDLSVLDGTVRFVTVTRTYSRSGSGAYGEDWDAEFDTVWSDEDPSPQ